MLSDFRDMRHGESRLKLYCVFYVGVEQVIALFCLLIAKGYLGLCTKA